MNGMVVPAGKAVAEHVKEMLDPNIQVQMTGVDLTVGEVRRFRDSGEILPPVIDFDKSRTRLPETEPVPRGDDPPGED